MSGDVEAALGAAQARELTARIRGALESAHGLISAAYAGRVWVALGYPSWDAYCAAELTGSRMVRLEPGQRREIVAEMRDAGMSTRAIASGLGASVGTVHADAAAGVQNRTPASGAGTTPATRGTDGKLYQRPAPGTHASPKVAAMGAAWAQAVAEGRTDMEPARKRKPLPEVALHLWGDVDRISGRLERLATDDRLRRNRGQVRSTLLRSLHRQRDAVDALIAALTEGGGR